MTPNDLLPVSIRWSLKTHLIGHRIIYRNRLPSTNSLAQQEARKGAEEGTVVITGEQTSGRGRVKRVWMTPEGNIALSIILRPEINYLPYLIMMSSLAVANSIEKVTGLTPQIKWPNDVLIRGKKVCGILIENDIEGNRLNSAVIGIGINVNLNPAEFSEFSSTATSLLYESGREVSRAELVSALLGEMERLYRLMPTSPDSIYNEWRNRLGTLGKRVRVKSGDEVLEGMAESVSTDGSLLLRRMDGRLDRIVSGDVTLREA